MHFNLFTYWQARESTPVPRRVLNQTLVGSFVTYLPLPRLCARDPQDTWSCAHLAVEYPFRAEPAPPPRCGSGFIVLAEGTPRVTFKTRAEADGGRGTIESYPPTLL
jgi:hypothetical protein